MKRNLYGFLVLVSLGILPLTCFALQQGIAASYGNGWIYQSNPQGVTGYDFAYNLHPDSWTWNNFTLDLDFNIGHWHTGAYSENNDITTYGIAPVLRWYFLGPKVITPFLQGSIGGAWLSSDYFGPRALGSHLLFQDMGGLGIAFGAHQNFYLTIQSLHYSNANIASHNSGFSVPCMISLGYQF